jgi:hypothetical protein
MRWSGEAGAAVNYIFFPVCNMGIDTAAKSSNTSVQSPLVMQLTHAYLCRENEITTNSRTGGKNDIT